MTTKTLGRIGTGIIGLGVIGLVAALAISRARAQNVPAWINQDDKWTANKATLQAFGEKFETAMQANKEG